jgi:hypothetical protein
VFGQEKICRSIDRGRPNGDDPLAFYIGTGMYGGLPVMPEVYTAAEQRHIEVAALPTPELCGRLQPLRSEDINAVLHVTC